MEESVKNPTLINLELSVVSLHTRNQITMKMCVHARIGRRCRDSLAGSNSTNLWASSSWSICGSCWPNRSIRLPPPAVLILVGGELAFSAAVVEAAADPDMVAMGFLRKGNGC